MSESYAVSEKRELLLDKVKKFILDNGGIVKKSQLAGLGIDYRRILDFVEKGDILRVKSGYYAVHLSDFTEEELVAKLFPDCVLNLENALYAYGYIKKKPYGWRLAVDKNTSKSRFKMDYPKIIPMYAEPDTLELGVTEIQLSNVTVRIFEKEIHKKKYSFIMQHVDAGEDEVDVALELIKEKKPRGIVFLGGFFSHSKEKLEQLAVPFVLSTIGMTDSLEESPFYSWVSVDDFAESYKMTDYLCKLGHKRILILAATKDDESIGRLRLEGYRKALKDNGIELDEDLCVFSGVGRDCYTMDYGFMAMSRILEEKKTDFTAVYAISDSIAIGACKAITEYGMKIPEDYSVAGFDGLDIAHYYNPTLTTIRQPVEEMAEATIKILFDVVSNHADHQKRVFKAELMEGESTRNVK